MEDLMKSTYKYMDFSSSTPDFQKIGEGAETIHFWTGLFLIFPRKYQGHLLEASKVTVHFVNEISGTYLGTVSDGTCQNF